MNVTARICDGANAPVATWLAIRRVIVVVFPDPAPARMQTGPRTASTARRCSAFRPPIVGSLVTDRPEAVQPSVTVVTRLSRSVLRDCRLDALAALLDHRRQPGDELERLALGDEPLELAELLLEPRGVDRSGA